ncbi:MAG: DUF4468 domain-containing protein [Williamsia sp.]|nr:DUF4468 domain-containing protein [Williamsia sp.]
MRFLFITLAVVGLLHTSYSMAICPPVITNGKLYGILPMANQTVTYSEVVDCGTISQADLYRRARLWVAQSCQSPGVTLALSDKETGDIVGGFMQIVTLPRSERSIGGLYTFRYSFVIECTNRKYRATITQIELEDNGAKPTPIETYCQKSETDLQAIYSVLDQQLKSRLASLQEAVKNYKSF